MTSILDSDVPIPASNAERQRRYRANSKDRYYANRKRYRHDNSKHQTDASYLSRPFVAWDGEGITKPDGSHVYVMLAVSDGNGKGYYLGNPAGLGTYETLSWILEKAGAFENAIHVIYGGGYDWNMILRDLSYRELGEVYRKKFAEWQGFRLAWRQGKSFYIAKVNDKGEKIGKGVTIYDCAPFFQCPFVKACDDYLGDRFQDRDLIVENKALRSSFTVADIPEVRRYNDAELRNLVLLMTELRERLNKVGLRPARWDGPGAIAAALLTREKVKDAKADTPEEVAKAARYAYAGGRFEVIRYGHSDRAAFEYDINSAYPAALRFVPNLAKGEWRYHSSDPGPLPFALYHLRVSGKDLSVPGPLFRRDPKGNICYPRKVTGWYWSPEYDVTKEWAAQGWGSVEVLGCWEFVESDPNNRPFDFIDGLFNKRRALKKARDGAHVGIKLGLNSLYGKLAQQVGWERKHDGSLRIPPFHQLEWAGFTTSYARATVMRAALTNMRAVIAFETDAIFTSEPLDVPIGSALGEFESVEFSNLTYLQSGLYFGELVNGEQVNKTRGVDRGSLTRSECIAAMAAPMASDRFAEASLTRFVGAGIALSQSFKRWRRWETMHKRIALTPQGKRVHLDCPACSPRNNGGTPITLDCWHETLCPFLNNAHSCQFPVEWINPDPNMTELSELREEGYSHDWDG